MSRRPQDRRALAELVEGWQRRAGDFPRKAGLGAGDRVRMVQHGQVIVHVVRLVDNVDGRFVEMVCGAEGEIAMLGIRGKRHPFVIETTAPATCPYCLAETV